MKTLYSELNELETHYKDFCESFINVVIVKL